MKKILSIVLAAVMLLALAACGGKDDPKTAAQPQNAPASSVPAATSTPETPAPAPAPETPAPAAPSAPAEVGSAVGGTLTVGASAVAVVVNGVAVPMPYRFSDLVNAGVPADESYKDIELGANDFFSLNLYLDENEDYLLIPAYYNGADSAIKITEAEAEEITLTTYAGEPTDQGVSIFGVSFGMAKSAVKALLGEPMSDDGSYCEWHIEVPDIAYEGTLSMYFTSDADDAGVSQIDLTVFEK